MIRPWVAALALVVGLSSCDQSTSRVSVLWTDVPEMASYVEKFNASQREWQLLVEYKQDLGASLVTPGRKADLVVARDLASSDVMNVLVPLDFLFDGGNLAKAAFYRRLLDVGSQGDKTKLLPVSFDLPVLVFSPDQTKDLPGFSVDLEGLRTLNRTFQEATKGTRSLGFSPRWGAFPSVLLQLEGVDFREGFQGDLSWNSRKLEAALRTYYEWPGPGWNQTTEFTSKYLQGDPGVLLRSGRIQFYPSTLATHLSRPWEHRRDLDFRFVGGARVAATDVVWAGIPSSALTRGAAERFLGWFFQAETQKRLMAQSRAEDPRAFGLASGLSAEVAPNFDVLASVFPDLSGRLPAADQVGFAAPLPLAWPALRTQVIEPWLAAPGADEAGLKDALEKFRTRSLKN